MTSLLDSKEHDAAGVAIAATLPKKKSASEYDRLLLPEIKLKTGNAAANVKQLEKRFNYLWLAAHTILPTSALLAHEMMSSMTEMARNNGVELPAAVLDFICECCGALLVPSLSADVRVQPQTHKSTANRKLTRLRRKLQAQHGTAGAPQILRNVLRVCCRRCEHVNLRAGVSEIVKPKSKKRPVEGQTEVDVAPGTKRAKTEPSPVSLILQDAAVSSSGSLTTAQPGNAGLEKPRSMFAPPPSPPRKLLDGPKKKKKKKTTDAAVVAVKSNLSSFLQSLRPSTTKK
ncbi:Rnase p, rpr2/rpp21 subunit, partial [Globisporangium splendens]